VVGLSELQGRLRGAPGKLGSETRSVMTAGLLLFEGDMKRGAPRDTGRLQGSIHHTIAGGGANLTGRVGPSVQYAIFVEKGTRAHFPPIGAISGWAKRHGVHPFALGRAIARRGTRAQPFVQPAFDRQRGPVVRLFDKIGTRVAVYIAGGR
jgi:HK97 gp10 family phage protein